MIKVLITDNSIDKSRDGALYKLVMQAIEKPLIENTLERTEGNQLRAARILGLNRNTMRSKIKKLGIDPKRWKVRA
jgi:two-component system nitrogen regulation response regulator GlnG